MTASAQPPSTAHVIRSDAEAIAVAHKLAARFAIEASVQRAYGRRRWLRRQSGLHGRC